MPSMNRVFIMGYCGADPELKYSAGGQPVCTFRLATTEKWSKHGEDHEKTEWHQVVVFGKQGEKSAERLRKGRIAMVEGKIQTREWEDHKYSPPVRRYMHEIVASTVTFIGSPPNPTENETPIETPPFDDEQIQF